MSSPAHHGGGRRSALPRVMRLIIRFAIRHDDVREGVLGDLEQEFADTRHPASGRLSRWVQINFAAFTLAVRFGFGGVLGTKTRTASRRHASFRSEWFKDLGKDVRFAFRGLKKSKGFFAVTVFSLALGIGVNTALLSVTGALLRPVPGVTSADRVFEVLSTSHGRDAQEFAYPDFAALRNADTPIAELAGTKQREATLVLNDVGQSVQAVYVSANFFRVLGVAMSLGRDFFPSEDVGPGLNSIAILSHDMWQHEFGADPGILGRTITLNRAPYTVVGVASREFRGHQPMKMGPYQPDLWVPITQHPYVAGDRDVVNDRLVRWLEVIGKLRDRVSLDEANVALSTVFTRLAEEYPETNEGRSARAAPFGPIPAFERAESLAGIALVFALAGLALLIICGNLAGMGLVRSASREREIAVRLALGSGRGRLVRFLMVEALILALIGGATGVFLAGVATSSAFLGRFGVVLPPHLDISPNSLVLALSTTLALATTLMFGLFPAIRFSRPELVSSLKDEAGGGGRRVGRTHRIAASAQTGLALSLLIVCGLCLRALSEMEGKNLGFEPSGLLVTRLNLSGDGNESFEDAEVFLDRATELVSSIPSITSVTVADGVPLDQWGNYTRVSREDRTDETRGRVLVEFTRATEGFFETIGTPILHGRGFESTDLKSSEPVAVITTSLAERLWPGENAVGRQVRFSLSSDSAIAHTIVGIVGHTASSRPTEDLPHLFTALRQNYQPRVLIAARGTMEPSSLVAPIRAAILEADPSLPIPNVQTSESMIDRSTIGQRINAQVAAGFGLLTLLLSAIGVYGVVAFSVTSRTREIGLRMAMGATRKQIVKDVFRDALGLAAPGLALGAIAAIATAAAMGSFLLGVSPVDPVSLGAGAAILLLVVLLASMVPARRASGIDPMDALRCE